MENQDDNYLDSVRKLFRYYKTLGDKAMAQVSDEGFYWRYNDESNSIAVIVKHIAGNSLSRWTDFLTTDGEKQWRNRDGEFDDFHASREEILALWNKGWNCLFNAVDSLSVPDLQKIVYIRNEGHTVVEAINRQLAHLPYHVGQIVFIARMLCGTQWVSLSIPKGQSSVYNDEKFQQKKEKKFFTDEENP